MDKLFGAISEGDVDRCRRTIVEMGHPDLNTFTNAQGDTPLTRAALHKAGASALGLCKLLLDFGASPRATMKHGRTALIEMVRRRGKYHIEVAWLLRGSINAADNEGRTPLMFAAEGAGAFASRRGNLTVAKHLIELGADPFVQNDQGKTALGYAIASNDKDTNQGMVDYLEKLMKTTIALREFDRLYQYDFNDNGCLSFSSRKSK
jgi:ankyrin repeat protein